jgi:hypothetical protein
MAKKVTKTQKGGSEEESNVETKVEQTTEQTETQEKAGETEAATDAPLQKGGSKKRTFKIKLADAEFCSRITGSTPKQAASKALTLLINQKKKSGKPTKGKVAFTIKETTRGSKGKEYSYQGEKVKLKTPTTYTIKSANGEVKTIVNKFKNVIEKHQVSA